MQMTQIIPLFVHATNDSDSILNVWISNIYRHLIVYSNNYCKSIVIMGGLGAQPPGAEITYIFTE